MASRSYSYTTVSVDPDGKTAVSVSLLPDPTVRVWCEPGRDRVQMVIAHAGAEVFITPTAPEAPTAEDVTVARKLAESFAVYAAEVERLHAMNGAVTESAENPAA
ncbi:hypothetical protein LUW76_13725 [Actinomadura madurae]|uniref:hypothetical protein n=1 Tax=Actinomadura madurae TaxID=1993 RepID=UPI002025DAD3|nr:hypothetical protein [Actinomadura madurae]URM95288.1 hypothetical protein LUW76_13725 [Actinomadura madurae]